MHSLQRYLNEHLAGSGAALSLVEMLLESNAADQSFFEHQREEILKSRRMLEDLMRRGGFRKITWMELTARMGSAMAQWRLKAQGLEPGKLALVEALEALTLGLSGQILLWNSLRGSMPRIGAWQDVDFDELVNRAETQRTQVEARRMDAARQAFAPV